jgi:hypothetical protein
MAEIYENYPAISPETIVVLLQLKTILCNSDAFKIFTYLCLPLVLMKISLVSRKSDWLGILGSIACLVHCLALPALFYFFQFTLNNHDSLKSHLLDYSFAIIATVAVSFAVRKSTSVLVRRVLMISLLFFVGGVLLETFLPNAIFLLHIGSLGLITGHALNIRRNHETAAHRKSKLPEIQRTASNAAA